MSMEIIEKLKNVGVHDAYRICSVPEKYRKWESTERIPGIKPTIQNFVEKYLLKAYSINSLYIKASVLEGSDKKIQIPRKIVEKCWCIVNSYDYTHCIVKRNDKFKLVPANEILESDEPITYVRRPKQSDICMVIRHPVKSYNCITTLELEITNNESVVSKITNANIEKLEGDFDGDSLLVLFFENTILDVEKPNKEKEVRFEIPIYKKYKNPETFWKPVSISKIMKFESPVNYVHAICQYVAYENVDIELLRKFLRERRFGMFLYLLASKKILEKAIQNNDIKGIYIIKDEWPELYNKVIYPKIKNHKWTNLDIDYSKELQIGRDLEKMFRLYFRGYGPKLSGYVQKVLLDISDVILEYPEVSKEFTDREIELIKNLEFLKLIDRLQQKVIDLKHRKNSLCNLDQAFELESIVKRTRLSHNEIKEVISKIIDDKEIVELCSKMLFIANIKRHALLTWSYGSLSKGIEGKMLKTWINEPVTKLFK